MNGALRAELYTTQDDYAEGRFELFSVLMLLASGRPLETYTDDRDLTPTPITRPRSPSDHPPISLNSIESAILKFTHENCDTEI